MTDNSAWLQRQDERLDKVERDLRAMQHEVSRQGQFERSQFRQSPQ